MKKVIVSLGNEKKTPLSRRPGTNHNPLIGMIDLSILLVTADQWVVVQRSNQMVRPGAIVIVHQQQLIEANGSRRTALVCETDLLSFAPAGEPVGGRIAPGPAHWT